MKLKTALLVTVVTVVQILIACTANPQPAGSASIPQPTSTNDPLGAAKVVQAFWDALGAGDVETAMAYVDDEITCAGYCHFTGSQIFQSYLQGYLDSGFETRIGDLKNIGGIVTYSWEVYRNGVFLRRGEDDEVMEVQDGKIIYWENYHR
jgi:hypothetical protein